LSPYHLKRIGKGYSEDCWVALTIYIEPVNHQLRSIHKSNLLWFGRTLRVRDFEHKFKVAYHICFRNYLNLFSQKIGLEIPWYEIFLRRYEEWIGLNWVGYSARTALFTILQHFWLMPILIPSHEYIRTWNVQYQVNCQTFWTLKNDKKRRRKLLIWERELKVWRFFLEAKLSNLITI
jgi:hypothetical protein